MAPHSVIPRLVLAVKGYLIMHRTWHCAWAMAARPYSPAMAIRPLADAGAGALRRPRSAASDVLRVVD